MEKFKHIITEEDNGLEIRQIIRKHFKFSSKLRTKIKYGNLISLNGVTTPGWKKVKVGDVITVSLPEEMSNFPPEDIPIDIIYEDDDLLLINKQPFITVHPTRGCPSHTLANGIMKYILDTDQSFKIRFVNRLDTDTSGILIMAKNSFTQNHITNQMKAKTIKKKYKALVNGSISLESLVDGVTVTSDDEFTVNLPIGRPDQESIRRFVMADGAPSVTHVKILERFKNHTLIELDLETGRTHQIRVHLSHIGHPIVGDSLYDGAGEDIISRQALHSYNLIFNHPITGELLNIEASLPKDIENAINTVKKD